MANEVLVKFKGDKKDLMSALDSSRGSIMSWGKLVTGALVGIGSLLAVKKVSDFGSAMVGLYQEQVAAERRLESVLRATGNAAGWNADQLKQMASQLQAQIGIGDEVILNTQAIIATFKNIRGDVFREATVAAADMAEIMGGDLKQSAIQISKALNDPIKGISALSRVGVTFTDQQKKQIAAMVEAGDVMGAQKVILAELNSEFGGAAADAANSFEGRITSLWNRVGDLGERIGGTLVPIIASLEPVMDLALSMMENLADSLSLGEDATQQFADSWSSYFVEGLKVGIGVATDVFSMLEFLYTNFSKLVERQTYDWILSFVEFGEEVKHIVTEAVPAYIQWLFDNWRNVIQDFHAFQFTVLKNMGKNFVEFFTSVTAWLTGDKGSFEFVALTEGFEATMEALPKIAERAESSTEQYLKNSMRQLDNDMGRSMNEIFTKNKKFIDGLFEERPEVEVDGEAVFEPFAKAVDDAGKEVEEAADKASKAAKKTKDEREKAEKANIRTSSLDSLAEEIQLAAINRDVQASNNQIAALQNQPGPGQQEVKLPDVAKVGEVLADLPNIPQKLAPIPEMDALLKEQKEHNPKMLKALTAVQGLA